MPKKERGHLGRISPAAAGDPYRGLEARAPFL